MSFAEIPVTKLKGVGPYLASCLKKINIETVQDLLFHLPFRYQDRTQITPIGQLRPWEHKVVEGKIELSSVVIAKRKSLLCYISDGTGHLYLRFFHFNQVQRQQLQRGKCIRCFGEIRLGKNGLEMIHPEYVLFNADEPPAVSQTLTAIYPATDGLSQHMLQKLTSQALQLLATQPEKLLEYIPENILQQFQLMPLIAAVQYLHRPPPDAAQNLLLENKHPAQQRLAFEELLAHQLSLIRYRARTKKFFAPSIITSGKLLTQLLQALPYALTTAQQRVIAEIIADLKINQPMLRLVQGDVGSGKTVVAAAVALYVLENDYQVAIMAPTELLAEQHYKNFSQWLKSFAIATTLLTSKLQGKNKENILTEIKNSKIKLIIGTQALFQEKVAFHNLALLIIDEHHRFGVDQRFALREKAVQNNIYPHQLVMTATPIPRTLTMAAYADLDCSVIDELPKGRIPVNTIVISNQRRAEIIARIREFYRQGKQIYWVCTLIEESELLQCQAAENNYQELKQLLTELRIGLIHGRLKPAEKEQIMSEFKNHQLDLLVATTVIEVGVDVPNASLMIIENAERLGLAQLHQLRGRVGRGNTESHCVLLYQAPLSWQAKQRLNIMREFNDGFKIAEQDLQLRGPGEILGTRQAGMLQFKICNLLRDKALLENVQQLADLLFKNYPDVIEYLIHRWLGENKHYANV